MIGFGLLSFLSLYEKVSLEKTLGLYCLLTTRDTIVKSVVKKDPKRVGFKIDSEFIFVALLSVGAYYACFSKASWALDYMMFYYGIFKSVSSLPLF